MRLLIAIILLAGLASAGRDDSFVYVSVAGNKRIAQYQLTDQGQRQHVRNTTLPGEPGALAVGPGKRLLFAALRSTGELGSFHIDPATGKLNRLCLIPAGADPAQLSIDRTGKFLDTAYYVAGQVTVHSIREDGTLTAKPVTLHKTAEKANAAVPDPSEKYLFVPHTGPSVIFQFRITPGTGGLTDGDPLRLQSRAGAGPRHFVFHPMLPIAYTSEEQGNSVTAYALDPKKGTLTPRQTVSTLPRDFKGENATAEIRIHPGGRFLYISNRGHNSIACFALDPKGAVSALGQVPTEKTPRSFDLDAKG
jgi:6-phosphogluconolactonase